MQTKEIFLWSQVAQGAGGLLFVLPVSAALVQKMDAARFKETLAAVALQRF